jgi:hypothetical protein
MLPWKLPWRWAPQAVKGNVDVGAAHCARHLAGVARGVLRHAPTSPLGNSLDNVSADSTGWSATSFL